MSELNGKSEVNENPENSKSSEVSEANENARQEALEDIDNELSPKDDTENDNIQETESFNELKDDYFDDVKSKSEYPETIDDSIKERDWRRIEPEENAQRREEFGDNKKELIKQWEADNGRSWPTYSEDVYSQNGKLIRRAGDKYDAHHVQPLTFDGKNESNNITPIHASSHYDKQGVHAPDSPYGKMERYGKED